MLAHSLRISLCLCWLLIQPPSAVAESISAPPAPAAPAVPGRHTHDGFLLRSTLQLNLEKASIDAGAESLSTLHFT